MNLDKLQPGDVVPGDYKLTQKLSKYKFFMATWRATRPDGQDVALNIYSTTTYDADASTDAHDLHPYMEALLPTLDTLKKLPAIPGVAPLLNYVYAPDSPVLILVRKFYTERLEDRYPPGQIERETVLTITRQLAESFDALRQHIPDMSFFVTPEHLMLEDDRAVMLDYGLERLLKVIEYSYSGSRPVTARWNYEMGWYPPYFFTEGNVPAEFALASLYYYFRTGFGVFEHHNEMLPAFSRINWDAITQYGEHRSLPEPLENAEDGEWAIIARALTAEDAYPSCSGMAAALSEV